MAKETDKKTEPQVDPKEDPKAEPKTVEIDGKTIPIDDVVSYYKNKSKFESDYHQKGEKVNQLTAQLAELQQNIEALTAQKSEPEKLPAYDDDNFVDALVGVVENTKNRLADIEKKFGDYEKTIYQDTIEDVKRKNLDLVMKFKNDHGLKDDEIKEVAEHASLSRRNVLRAGGRILELKPEALEDALLIVKKDEIKKRSEEDGAKTLLNEILGGGKLPSLDKKESNEQDLKWAAENWHTLTDEQKVEWREKMSRESIVMPGI